MADKIRIKRIEKVKKDKVYDIHHKIATENFLEEHPNIIANDVVISNCGRHAGGVIISDNVYENMPVKRSNNVMQTPWTEGLNGHQLEPLGFLKFDILAVGTLRVIEDTIRKILANKTNRLENEIPFNEVKAWFDENLHPDNNSMDDQEVYEYVYHKGNWSGVFQFAQPPVRKFVMALKPRNIDDISASTSIYRPGPLKAGVDKLYLQNRANKANIKYKHPMLKEILDNQEGCIDDQSVVYTDMGSMTVEQLLEVCRQSDYYSAMTETDVPAPKILTQNQETKELEFDELVAIEMTGVKPTITLNFDDGTFLTLTEDHIVFTKDGEKQAGQLTEKDEIISVSFKKV